MFFSYIFEKTLIFGLPYYVTQNSDGKYVAQYAYLTRFSIAAEKRPATKTKSIWEGSILLPFSGTLRLMTMWCAHCCLAHAKHNSDLMGARGGVQADLAALWSVNTGGITLL